MGDETLMNSDGTCAKCGHVATEHANGCSLCDCDLVAEAAKETEETRGIGSKIGVEYGVVLRKP